MRQIRNLNFNIFHSSEFPGLFVAGIGVARNTDPRVIRQHAIEALGHLIGAVGNDHLSGMQRVANSRAAPVVKRDPTRAGSRVQQRVEDGPIGDRVTPILHAFSLSERGSDGAAVQMVAANDDRSFNFSGFHKMIDALAKLSPFTVSQPADACRQTLKPDFLPSEMNPPAEDLVFRKELENKIVRDSDVAWTSRE